MFKILSLFPKKILEKIYFAIGSELMDRDLTKENA